MRMKKDKIVKQLATVMETLREVSDLPPYNLANISRKALASVATRVVIPKVVSLVDNLIFCIRFGENREVECNNVDELREIEEAMVDIRKKLKEIDDNPKMA